MASPSSSSSSPYTPAGSVPTAVKATARSPFFHAHLQRGLRLRDESGEQESLAESDLHRDLHSLSPSPEAGAAANVTSAGRASNDDVIAAVPGASSVAYASNYAGHQHQQQAPSSLFPGNGCDENQLDAHAARGVPTLKVNTVAARTLRAQASSSTFSSSKISPHTAATHFSSSSIRYPSSGPNSAMPVPAADQDFWEGVKEASVSTPVGPRSHYLTRSQSSGPYQATTPTSKVRKKGSLNAVEILEPTGYQYASHVSSSLRSEYEPRESDSVDITSGAGLLPSHKQLSPINESPFSDEYRSSPLQGDASSIHSTRSEKSKLFINRPVRRTGSASSFNSQHSVPPRNSPDEVGAGTLGFRSRTPLSIIPGSPRVSNVHDIEPGQQADPNDQLAGEGPEQVLKFPMPAMHPPAVQYGSFPQSAEELHDTELRHTVPHSVTPSLLTLSRSASQSTQLTYLTADDAGNTRRSRLGSGAAGRRSQLAESFSPRNDNDRGRDRERGDNASLPRSVATRLKTSIEDLLSKSSRMTSSALKRPIASAAPSFKGALTLLNTAHAPWAAPQSKPSEVLFWTGFIAPWCWLIGGWMLTRSGETTTEGLRFGAKEENYVLPMYRNPNAAATAVTQDQPVHGLGSRSQSPAHFPDMQTQTQTQTQEGKGLSSIWKQAKNSSAELLSSIRPNHSEEEKRRLKPMHLKGDARAQTSAVVETPIRLDPWVIRCRIAAVISGALLLALLIVALVVLVRAL